MRGRFVMHIPRSGEITLTFEVQLDTLVRLATRYGDRKTLAWCLRQGAEISPELKSYLTDVLDGTVPRPNNRAPSVATRVRQQAIKEYVEAQIQVRQLKKEAAVSVAMETFGMDRRTIYRALRDTSPD
jgi:hypothetical protein